MYSSARYMDGLYGCWRIARVCKLFPDAPRPGAFPHQSHGHAVPELTFQGCIQMSIVHIFSHIALERIRTSLQRTCTKRWLWLRAFTYKGTDVYSSIDTYGLTTHTYPKNFSLFDQDPGIPPRFTQAFSSQSKFSLPRKNTMNGRTQCTYTVISESPRVQFAANIPPFLNLHKEITNT